MIAFDDATAWRPALEQWCHEFRLLLQRGWDRSLAATLFERVEAQPALTANLADAPVAEAAAELTLYLCGFVDGGTNPNPEQRIRLDHLTDELLRALNAADLRAAHRTERAPPRVFRVHHVLAEDAAGGAEVLAPEPRLSVSAFAGIEAAREAVTAEGPDAVLVDAGLLASLPRLSDAARLHSAGGWRRVLWAAAGIGEDLRLRLHARRVGIDVLVDADPRRASATLLSALLRRREEAYRVLIVEDDRSQIAFASTLLRHQGFEVDVAESSAEALARVRERVPDLVLLDIHLPDMTGVELAQLLREQANLSHVPLVFLTGEDDVDVRAEAIAAGGDDFISKPVRPRHLISVVNSRIGRARTLAAAAAAEPIDLALPVRLERQRFFDALDVARQDAHDALAVVAIGFDQPAAFSARLGFLRAGEVATQLAQAVATELRESAPGCAVGEFTRLALVTAPGEEALRARIGVVQERLARGDWLRPAIPSRAALRIGAVRCDGSPAGGEAVIAAALAELERARAADAGVGYRALPRE